MTGLHVYRPLDLLLIVVDDSSGHGALVVQRRTGRLGRRTQCSRLGWGWLRVLDQLLYDGTSLLYVERHDPGKHSNKVRVEWETLVLTW